MGFVLRAEKCGGIQRGAVLHSAGGSMRGARPLSHPDGQWTVRMYLRHLRRQRGEASVDPGDSRLCKLMAKMTWVACMHQTLHILHTKMAIPESAAV